MSKTNIRWTDETWNPVRGCSRVSEGCRHCYAEVQAERIVRMGRGKPTPYDGLVRLVGGEPRWTGEVAIDGRRLAAPLRWREPRRVFVDSMSDLFYDRRPNEHIAAVFGVMAATPHITYQILTKYAQRMHEWFQWAHPIGKALLARQPMPPIPRALIEDAALGALNGVFDGIPRRRDARWPLPNVWLGVSTENQAAAEERIPELLATPAAVRFISAEPLLGEVDLDLPRCDDLNHGPSEWGLADDDATPWCSECDTERSYGHWLHPDGGIDWVIDGCESGPGARPAVDAWFASLAEQCLAAGVPYFHKQQVVNGRLVHDVADFPSRLACSARNSLDDRRLRAARLARQLPAINHTPDDDTSPQEI